MPQKIKLYGAILANVVVGALSLWLAGACLNALIFTGEIGFGRTNRMANITTAPNDFWFAFWFQLLLAGGALAYCWHDSSKKLNLLCHMSADHKDNA